MKRSDASMSNDDSIKYPSKYYMNNIYGTYKLINACVSLYF